jgi:hypothetical protein
MTKVRLGPHQEGTFLTKAAARSNSVIYCSIRSGGCHLKNLLMS